MIDQNLSKADSSFNKNILDTSNDYSVLNDFNHFAKLNFNPANNNLSNSECKNHNIKNIFQANNLELENSNKKII
jgi:hypothetical protein